MQNVKLGLFPSQQKFVFSEAPIVFFIGPQGEGKTYAGFVACVYHAQRANNTVKAGLIRDTHTNIKAMTVPSIEDVLRRFPRSYKEQFRWRDDYHKLYGPKLELTLMGMDSTNDINKLMGAGYSLIWLEEPAPMMSGASQGIPENAFKAAIARSGRQTDVGVSRVQVTMNPSDEYHWTTIYSLTDPIMNPEYAPDIYTEVIHAKPGENEKLSSKARQAIRAAYAGDKALWDRYVEGKVAFVISGTAVTPEYREEIHRSKGRLDPYTGITCYRFWDAGHNPTCIICQVDPLSGRLCVLDSIVGEGIGMKQLVAGVVKPLMQTRYKKITSWIDSGDPALNTRDQGDTDNSPAAVIERELDATYIPGVTDWQIRKQLIKKALTESPMILLSEHEKELHLAFRGGWAMKKLSTGHVVDTPPKGRYSHPADAISQGLGVFYGEFKRGPKVSVLQKMKSIYENYRGYWG